MAFDFWSWIGPDLAAEVLTTLGGAAVLWAVKKNAESFSGS